MDIQLRKIAAAVAATVALGYSANSMAAQDQVTDRSSYVTGNGDVVHCVSTENGRTYCGRPHQRYVIVGNAPSACVEGSTWGFDDRGVWVTGGCVADFNTVYGSDVNTNASYVNDSGRVVHCVSTSSGRTYCGRANVRYAIVDGQNENATACIEGKTWGDDDRGVWVSGGCAANFDPSDASASARRTTFVDDSGRTVHCVSTEGGRTYCGAAHKHYDLAGTPNPVCVEGSTWGYDDRGMWVSGGCVADFRVMNDGDVVETNTAYVNGNRQLVHCVSAPPGRTYCGGPNERYVINGTPNAACIQNTTWGMDDRGVWVSDGCAADFVIEGRSY